MGSFSIWHWLVVLLVVVLIFGTKKLKNIGSDLGAAVKGFKDGVKEGGTDTTHTASNSAQVPSDIEHSGRTQKETIDVQAKQQV